VTVDWKEKWFPKVNVKPSIARKRSVEFSSEAYYLHSPYISFHCPPRVLRRGGNKHAPPICLLHNSFLWRRWRLQFGDILSQKGVIDPRGAISWDYNEDSNSDEALKGYKVRSWRLWGESGKKYHQQVNLERQQSNLQDEEPSLVQVKSAPADPGSEKHHLVQPPPAKADLTLDVQSDIVSSQEASNGPIQAITLHWESPFSKATRRYSFRFGEIDFYWKGTGTVKHEGSWSWIVRFNHLKLVARLPAPLQSPVEGQASPSSDDPSVELILARYTSSPWQEKCGELEVFDSVVRRFVQSRFNPIELAPEKLQECDMNEAELDELRKTRLYDLIMATTLCMVIGERQKRETLREVIQLLAAEGGGNAG
jgi:hypothetical protein